MRTFVAIALAAIILALVTPPRTALGFGLDKVAWKTLSEGKVAVYYGTGFESDAKEVMSWMQVGQRLTTGALDLEPTRPVKVYLFPSNDLWPDGETRVWADLNEDRIRLLTPSLYQNQQGRAGLPNIMAHEWVHIIAFQHRPAYRSDPLWYVEGLADYIPLFSLDNPLWPEETAEYEKIVANLARNGELNLFAIGSEYEVGSQAVRFLYATYGREKMSRVFKSNTGDIRSDLESVLGLTWAQLHDEWLLWVSRKFQIPLDQVKGTAPQRQIPIGGRQYLATNVTANSSSRISVEGITRTVRLQVGQTTFTVDGQSRTADAAPFLENGRTMVPLRALAEALGASVSWNAAEERITISRQPGALAIPQYVHVPKELVDFESIRGVPVIYVEARAGTDSADVDQAFGLDRTPFFRLMPGAAWIRAIDLGNGKWRSQYPIAFRGTESIRHRICTPSAQCWDLADYLSVSPTP